MACPHGAADGGAGKCERCASKAAKRENGVHLQDEETHRSTLISSEEVLRRLKEFDLQVREFHSDAILLREEIRDTVADFRTSADELREDIHEAGEAAEAPEEVDDAGTDCDDDAIDGDDDGPMLVTSEEMSLPEMENLVFDRCWHEGNGDKLRARREIDLLTKVGARELRRYNSRGSRLWMRRRRGMRRGRRAGHQRPPGGMRAGEIAVIPTIVAAAERVGGIGKVGKGLKIEIQEPDIRERLRRGRTPCAVVVVMDLGSSVDEEAKQACVLPAVLDILRACYERRDDVALVYTRGNRAEVAQEFTTDLDRLYALVQRAEFGGLSPLASGITKGLDLLNDRMRVPLGIVPILIVLTDGRANVPLYHGGHIKRELWRISRAMGDSAVSAMFVDVSERGDRLVRDLAAAADGVYFRPKRKVLV